MYRPLWQRPPPPIPSSFTHQKLWSHDISLFWIPLHLSCTSLRDASYQLSRMLILGGGAFRWHKQWNWSIVGFVYFHIVLITSEQENSFQSVEVCLPCLGGLVLVSCLSVERNTIKGKEPHIFSLQIYHPLGKHLLYICNFARSNISSSVV